METESFERFTANRRFHSSSDEDTEDASEPEMFGTDEEEHDRQRSYQEKMTALKEQLRRIQSEDDPELQKNFKELREVRDKRIHMAETFREYELKVAREEYEREKAQALQDFDAKRTEIKENLLMDLQEKKKSFENLRSTMEITTGSFLFEPKMMVTRKLRRRNYEPIPVPDKRRRTSPFCSALVYELEDTEIEEDLKIICKGKPQTPSSSTISRMTTTPGPTIIATTPDQNMIYDVRVEEGKLHYEGKCFSKNQHVVVESKDRGVETAIISSISHSEIIVKLLPDHAKLRIYLSHLSKGKYVIKKKN